MHWLQALARMGKTGAVGSVEGGGVLRRGKTAGATAEALSDSGVATAAIVATR